MLYNFQKEVDLTKPDFNNFLGNVLGKKDFILFVYAPWCGHCRDFHPKLDVAIQNMKQKHNFIVVKLEDEAFSHLARAHPDHMFGKLLNTTVQGFPSLMHVHPLQKSPQGDKLKFEMFENIERNVVNTEKFIKHASIKDNSKKTSKTKAKKRKPTAKKEKK